MSAGSESASAIGRAALSAELAATARILARAGLVHAFGHVSARTDGGCAITPTYPPLIGLAAADVIELDGSGAVVRGDRERLPLEAPMHISIYRRRRDVGAIARIHGGALAAWAARLGPPPLLHGFGGIVEPLAFWADPDLITDAVAGDALAATLGDARAVVLRGNGGLAVAGALGEAAARAWCLEDRCSVAERADGRGKPFSGDELVRRRRWFDAEERRLWAWMQLAYAASPKGL